MDLIGSALRARSDVATRTRNALPVPYRAGGALANFGAFFSRNGKSAQLAQYEQVGTLYGTVSAIATASAKEEWWIERKSPQRRVYGPAETRTRQVLKHPAIELWDNPNPFYSRAELVELLVTHLMLAGEAYGVFEMQGTLPIRLWPVLPDRMTPVPSARDFLAGYVYTAPGGEQIPLDVSQVLAIKLPSSTDVYRGASPVMALMADLDSVRYSAEWNRQFFLNDATPGGVVQVPNELNDAKFARLREQWREQHQGVTNAHRVAVLEMGATFQPQTVTQRDMQFVEARNVARDAIREAYRVHKTMLGQSDDVNRASALAAADQMGEYVVDPTLTRLRGALNSRLLPMYGTPVVDTFCYSSPVKGDQAEEDDSLTKRVAAYATLIDKGVDPIEAAEVCGLPPMTIVENEPVPPEPPEEITPSEDDQA